MYSSQMKERHKQVQKHWFRKYEPKFIRKAFCIVFIVKVEKDINQSIVIIIFLLTIFRSSPKCLPKIGSLLYFLLSNNTL